MFQITVIDAGGTRYPIAWFSSSGEATAYADTLREKWTVVLIHEVQAVILRNILINRDGNQWIIN